MSSGKIVAHIIRGNEVMGINMKCYLTEVFRIKQTRYTCNICTPQVKLKTAFMAYMKFCVWLELGCRK